MKRLLAQSLNYNQDIGTSTCSIEVKHLQTIAHTPQPQGNRSTAVATSWDLIQHETTTTEIPTR
jgi:hypothetical protein